jgi:uncharacterized RDD family membrane protein YckC
MSELPSYPQEAAEREAAERPPGAPPGGYASWGRRAAAYLLDSLIVFVAIMAAALALVGVGAAAGDAGVIAFVLIPVAILGFVVFYYIYLVGKDGQTWARRWLGIRVQHESTGDAIGYGAATGRYLITFLFGIFTLPLILDFLWPLWDGRNQTLHDKMVSSVVARV